MDDEALRAMAEAALAQASAPLHHSTFGPGGPAAPREVTYRQDVLPGGMLGELTAFYRAFAYEPTVPEPPDHMAIEAGFVGYLKLKEAFALERGEAEQVAVVAAAARRFLDDHLNPMVEPLALALTASGIEYLAHAGAALLERVGPCRRSPLPMAAVADGAACCEHGEEDAFPTGRTPPPDGVP